MRDLALSTVSAVEVVISTETRAEAVPIAANLRHNDLDALVTEDNLAHGAGAESPDYRARYDIADAVAMGAKY